MLILLPVVFLTALLSGVFGMAGGLLLMGVFTALDVPDRVGPTWSRRSG